MYSVVVPPGLRVGVASSECFTTDSTAGRRFYSSCVRGEGLGEEEEGLGGEEEV